MILISFVVPAYNASSYLLACIDSIYRLPMQDWGREVIVVNDGSTDRTNEVLQSCLLKYPDFVVLQQDNRGQSSARNRGMKLARGKYLCFVDADDELDVEGASALDWLWLESRETDLIGVNLQEVTSSGMEPYRRYVPPYNQVFSPACEFLKGRNLLPCPVAYLYRREFIEREQLHFHEGIVHEDEEWSVLVMLKAGSFIALDVNFYHRYIRQESTTTTTNRVRQERKLRDMLVAIQTLHNYLSEHPEMKEFAAYKMDYLAVDLIRLLFRQRHSWTFCLEMLAELKRMGYFPLRKHKEWKYRFFSFVTRCIF